MFNKQLEERVRRLEESERDRAKELGEAIAATKLLEGQIKAFTEHISSLSKALSDLTEAHRSLLDQLREKEQKLETAVPFVANYPLWMSEEEEDARYRLEQGDIDKEMYGEILEELGLSPNIEVLT